MKQQFHTPCFFPTTKWTRYYKKNFLAPLIGIYINAILYTDENYPTKSLMMDTESSQINPGGIVMKKFNLVPIETVLHDYCGVKVSSGRSQQNVECPFHNDTSKNSLCLYKNTNSAYCFAGCGNFGPVEIVMRQLGVDQAAATQELMSRYGLAPLTPEDEARLR